MIAAAPALLRVLPAIARALAGGQEVRRERARSSANPSGRAPGARPDGPMTAAPRRHRRDRVTANVRALDHSGVTPARPAPDDARDRPTPARRRYVSLRARLALGLAVLVGLAFVEAVVVGLFHAESNGRVERMYSQEVVPLEALDDAKSAMYRIRGATLEHIHLAARGLADAAGGRDRRPTSPGA